MDIKITQKTEIIDGRGYLLTLTRISGMQEVYVNGVRRLVSQVTFHDCRDGCAVTSRRAPLEPEKSGLGFPPTVQARLKELGGKAILDQGL